jgi:hypothetical protein
VWGDHDINFKQLNSQLLKEVEEYEAAHASARTVAGIDAVYDPTAAPPPPPQQQQQPARGRTLAKAAAAEGQQQLLTNHRVLPASELARAAALARQQQQQQQQQQLAASSDQQPGTVATGHAPSAAAEPALAGATGHLSGDMAAAAAAAAAAGSEEDLQQYEHDDPMTAAAEAAAERLGSLQTNEPADVDMLPTQQDVLTQSQAQLPSPPSPSQQQGQQQQHLDPNQQLPQQQWCAASQGQSAAAAAAAAAGFAFDTLSVEQAASCHKADQQDVTAAAAAAREEGCTCCGEPSAEVHMAPAETPAVSQSVMQEASQEAVHKPRSSRGTAEDQPHCHPAAADGLAAATEGSAAANGSAVADAAAGAASAEEALLFEGLDDVLKGKLQQAGQLVQQLVQQSGDGAATNTQGDAASTGVQQQQQQQQQQVAAVLEALQDVLRNLAQHPSESRCRRLRCNNATFHRRLGRFPAARQLLVLAGFAEQQQQQQAFDGLPSAPEPVLVYVRDDPGLVWLVLSVVRQALEQVSC